MLRTSQWAAALKSWDCSSFETNVYICASVGRLIKGSQLGSSLCWVPSRLECELRGPCTYTYTYTYTYMHANHTNTHRKRQRGEWVNMSNATCHTMDTIDRLTLQVSWAKEASCRGVEIANGLSHTALVIHITLMEGSVHWVTSVGFQFFKDGDLSQSYGVLLCFVFLRFAHF